VQPARQGNQQSGYGWYEHCPQIRSHGSALTFVVAIARTASQNALLDAVVRSGCFGRSISMSFTGVETYLPVDPILTRELARVEVTKSVIFAVVATGMSFPPFHVKHVSRITTRAVDGSAVRSPMRLGPALPSPVIMLRAAGQLGAERSVALYAP
jgi:hypothetical protein